MSEKRIPRYDTRNDGLGPYAIFYCDKCSREYRSQPDVKATITQDIGRNTVSNALRGIPLFGRAAADAVMGEDPRYTYALTPDQLKSAWAQVSDRFQVCPTCQLTVCLSCWDAKAGTCVEDSPRSAEIAEAQAEQAAGVMKGVASAFGLGGAFAGLGQAMKQASATATTTMARCPNDGTLAPAGTKFCTECGAPMVQPVVDKCPSCGAEVRGAKFCPECGTRIERAEAGPKKCPNCGAEATGAKFCTECGTRLP
mgnify:CR=1 FL=1